MRGLRVVWVGVVASGLLFVVFFVLGGAQAAQVEPDFQRGAIQSGAQWLVEQHQNEDGGFTSFSSGAGDAPSDVAGTADAILALASTGYNVAAPYPGREQSAIDFLQSDADAVAAYAAQGGGASGKLILALSAAAQDPRNFDGYDFTISHTQHLSPTGQYSVVSPYEQSLAILAQSVVSDAVPATAVSWLLAAQAQDGDLAGSWDDGFGTAGNVDATAMAVMALITAGGEQAVDALAAARTFLMEAQLESGGWGYAPGLPESANSTALTVQALSAMGEDFYSADGEWVAEGVSPLAALLAWQSDSGAFQADFGDGPADDFFTTVQALPALTGRPYPLPARFEAAQRALSCLATMQDAQSGGWPEFAGSGPSAGGTARAIRAVDAAGGDLSSEQWAAGGIGPVEALRSLAPAYLAEGRGGRVGIVMRGAVAGGEDAGDFDGLDLPLMMTEYLSPTGEYDDTAFGPYSHAQAMLGLLSAGQEVDDSAVTWLLEAQAEDGGWDSADATGISLQVIAQLDGDAYADVMNDALENLQATQQVDGGWGFALPSSVNSTSEVAQGLTVAGENPFDPTWSVVTSGTLRNGADLALAQQGGNGCWPNLFGEGDDPYATTDGIILLSLSPVWGAVAGAKGAQTTPEATAQATEEAEATAEPTVAPEPTATEIVVIEETEVAPSPTAEPAGADESAAAGEATATRAVELTVSPATGEVDGGDDPGPILLWIIGALILLVLVMVYFRLTTRR